MKIKGNTVLITGGATGIGLALAELFIKYDNEVIICGRRESRLRETKARLPELHIRVCDISGAEERQSLFNWVEADFPKLNVLVNNAGTQERIDFKKCSQDHSNEIETNLTAPVHLSCLFIPLLLEKDAAIVNISSSLAFRPMPHVPVYCATKAAIHAFSVALREQLRETSVQVFEVIPPLVDTELHGGRLEKRQLSSAISPSVVAAATLEAIGNDEHEIIVGEAIKSLEAGRARLEEISRHRKDPGTYQ